MENVNNKNNSYFLHTGSTVSVRSGESLTVTRVLEPKTYFLKENPNTGEIYLEITPDMPVAERIYGKSIQFRTERIFRSYSDRPRNTGVLLSGEKGSGKTLLIRQLSHYVKQHNVPTIIINAKYKSTEFINFFNNLTTPSLIVFDEFEKIYEGADQNVLLSVLDGIVNSKHLFVLSTNSDNVNNYFLNRPGRIYYAFEYTALEEEVILEYAQEHLKNQEHLNGLIKVCSMFTALNFDMLQALVEEMNRFGENAVEVVKHINVSPNNERSTYFKISVTKNGHPLKYGQYDPTYTSTSPLTQTEPMQIYVYANKQDKDNEDDRVVDLANVNIDVSVDNIKSIRPGRILIEQKIGNDLYRVALEREVSRRFNYDAF